MSNPEKQKEGKTGVYASEVRPGNGVQLTDRFGNVFHIGFCRELQLPAFPLPPGMDYRDMIDAVVNFPLRHDDILLCSFPKTGTHWTSNIIMMLLKGHSDFSKIPEEGGLMEMGYSFVAQKLPETEPRLLNMHVPVNYIPKDAFKKKSKIILLHRNPKDVLVSLWYQLSKHTGELHYPGTFEQFFYLRMEMGGWYGDLLDWEMDWQNAMEANPEAPVCEIVFEDMKQDPVSSVCRLNDYLGTGRSQEMCAEIAKACGFSSLKAARDGNEDDRIKQLFKDKKPVFYRKGEVGDWKNHFTVAMNEQFDAVYKKRMEKFKLKYKYTL